MSELDVDRWSRSAGAALREEAERFAESEAALAELRAMLADGTGVALAGLDSPPAAGTRRRWLAIGTVAAASILAVVLTVTLRDDSVQTVDTPTSPSTGAPTTVPTTGPATTNAPPVTTGALVPSTPTSAVPATSGALSDTTIDLAAVVTDAGPRPSRELYRAGIGSGPDQLGTGDFEEPWAPILVNGVLVIADVTNHRWVTSSGSDGTTITPFADGFDPISRPVDGPDGLVYVVDRADGEAQAALRAYGVADLATPVASYPVERVVLSTLWVDGQDVLVNGEVVTTLDAPFPSARLPEVEWLTGLRPQQVVVTSPSARRTWVFASAQGIGGVADSSALPDGSVLVSDQDDQSVVRLFPDGTAVRFAIPGVLMGQNGSMSFDDLGPGIDVIRLEADGSDLVVRSYPLPITGLATPIHVVPLEATGDATAICTAALQLVSAGSTFGDGVVVADEVTSVDGGQTRWLVCAGPDTTTIAVTSTDSRHWKLAVVGGVSFHAGDVSLFAVDGARATVTYRSWVGEDFTEARTTDGGVTWTSVALPDR